MTEEEIETQENPLSDLFTLPEPYSNNPQISRWYNEIIARQQREAAGLPMQINQIQLLERMAFFYVAMRYKEQQGETISPRDMKDANAEWRNMFDAFSRSIEKHKDQILRDTVLQIQGIIEEVLNAIEDDDVRKKINRQFIEGFAAAGL